MENQTVMFMDRWLRKALCSLAFLLVAGLGGYWTHLSQDIGQHEQQLLIADIVSAQASAIERRLSRSLSSTDILAQEVIQHGGEFDQFEVYAEAVLRSIGGVSNLQLAPDGVIKQIYPLAGNEKAIGHNLLVDDRRRKEARQAIREQHLTLAGPFELVQGGIAVVGRNPVFLTRDGKERFWGFASALIFLDDLLSVTQLDQLSAKGYSFQLSRIHPDTGQLNTFARSATDLSDVSHSTQVKVPNDTWTLTMSRIPTGPDRLVLLGDIASLALGALAAWLTCFMLRQPEKLRCIVQQKTAELEKLAFYDHLTGLANRRLLSEQLDHKIREAIRYRKPIAFLFLDLDDFKRINDTLGHEAGDLLLKQIALRLQGVVRDSDIVARFGGDEFGVLLLDAESVRDVSRIAKKLIETISEPVSIYDEEFIISPSIGISMVPADGRQAVEILKHADIAMYSAKKSGKRNYCFFEPSLQAEALKKVQIERELNEAINANQFVLHYQPLIDLRINQVMGYEALIRWQHPIEGLLYPDRFIGAAEDTGNIIEIGYWGIRQACATLKQRALELKQWQHIAVNLSPRQFADPDLLDNIRAIVRQADIDARCLEIEITESTLMANVDEAITTLEQLQLLGIRIAIDDFGTGYSSLALLKRLPVDKLKIDRSFVRLLESDPSDRKIVNGIISMAHALDIQVTAEGIETVGQLELLRGFDCDYGQGYLFNKPVPLEQLEQPVEVPLYPTRSCLASSGGA